MKNTNTLLSGLALALVCLTFTACGSDYKYNLTENGCSTGDQSFGSQKDMCNGLKNDDLNHDCAYSLRQEKYQSDCSSSN